MARETLGQQQTQRAIGAVARGCAVFAIAGCVGVLPILFVAQREWWHFLGWRPGPSIIPIGLALDGAICGWSFRRGLAPPICMMIAFPLVLTCAALIGAFAAIPDAPTKASLWFTQSKIFAFAFVLLGILSSVAVRRNWKQVIVAFSGGGLLGGACLLVTPWVLGWPLGDSGANVLAIAFVVAHAAAGALIRLFALSRRA